MMYGDEDDHLKAVEQEKQQGDTGQGQDARPKEEREPGESGEKRAFVEVVLTWESQNCPTISTSRTVMADLDLHVANRRSKEKGKFIVRRAEITHSEREWGHAGWGATQTSAAGNVRVRGATNVGSRKL